MAREITDMQIKLISLVSAGANNKKNIYKNENFNELLRVDFKKSDVEQGVCLWDSLCPGRSEYARRFCKC